MITEKRFKVAVYDDKAINGFAVLDLQKPNSSKRLKYENVYIGSKAGCEIVCNFGNSLADENRQLKQALREQLEENGNTYCIEILDKIFDLKYDEWQRKMNETHTYNYIDWENVLNDKGGVE